MSEYIDRAETIGALLVDYWISPPSKELKMEDVLNVIKNIPAADVVDKHSIKRGQWITYYDYDTKEIRYLCNQCRKEQEKSDFCDSCGALMDTYSFMMTPEKAREYIIKAEKQNSKES